MSKAGVSYLNKDLKLKDKKVFFQPIKPTHNDLDTFDCDITVKKVGFVRVTVVLFCRISSA